MAIYTIPGPEPAAGVEFLASNNGDWTLSRDGNCWSLEHKERGMIEAGPVSWEILRFAYCGEMVEMVGMSKSLFKRMQALVWEPEDGPPPASVSALQLLGQDVWWITKNKRKLRVEDMGISHARNLLAFLLRHAEQYRLKHETGLLRGPQPSGEMASYAFDDACYSLFNQPAEDWMMEFPLLQALQRKSEVG